MGSGRGAIRIKKVKRPLLPLPLTKDRDRGSEARLAVIASLPYHLSRLPLRKGLSLALDALLKVTHAEIAELFLSEPVTGDIILAAHRGPFRNAFFQLARFRPGEGYPGIIAVNKEPIFTTKLQTDPRYLRTGVKDLGFRSYLCIPLEAGGETVGSLNLASRQSRRDFPEYARLLSWAASSIAMAVRMRLYEIEKLFETSVDRVTGEVDGNLDSIVKDLLNNVAASSEGSEFIAALYDTKSGKLISMALKGTKEKNACIPELSSKCPALNKAHVVINKSVDKTGTMPCRNVPCGQSLRVCMPLIFNKQPLGVFQLGYKKSPQPPTKDVALVASAACQTASLLIMNWHYLNDRDNVIRAARSWHSGELSKPAGRGDSFEVIDDIPVSSAATGSRIKEKPGHVLTISCLGSFQVFRDGELVPVNRFVRRKAVTLLKILAIKTGAPVPAEALAEYLWPEQSPKLTSHRLEMVVSELRRVLDYRSDGKRWQFIHNDRGFYRLDLSEACRLDVDDYRQILSKTRYFAITGTDEETIALYQELDKLYRGDLLEDEPYADWCWMERETLRETHLDILRQIAAALIQKGNLEFAIHYYRKALRMDPLREELHRQLIQTLLKAGRRDEALRQYVYCREVLKHELDISPSAETEALHKILLQQVSS